MTSVEPNAAGPARWRDLLVDGRAVFLAIINLAVLLHAMDTLLMATILPSAVQDVGGLEFMAWPSSIFMIASVTAAAAAARMKAAMGGRNAFATSCLVFFAGTLLCGIAPDMGTLIAGRALQGVGGGLLAALAYALVNTFFPENLWARVFALLSGVWGIASLTGPLIGGIAASAGSWRSAFYAIAALALILTVLVYILFPRDERKAAPAGDPYPTRRLALVALSVLAVSVAGTLANPLVIAALIAGGIASFGAMLRLDRKAVTPILPTGAFAANTVVGFGLWITICLAIADAPIAVYGPLFMQTIHGWSPLEGGFLIATASMGWTVAAIIVASLPYRWSGVILVAGPAVMGAGIAGSAFFIPTGPAVPVVVSVAAIGCGIGMCWTFLTQRVMSHARDGEGDIAAASIPTIQLIGLAMGAAIAGLTANLSGFATGLTVETARHAAFVTMIVVVPFTAAATLAAIALRKHERPAAAGKPPRAS